MPSHVPLLVCLLAETLPDPGSFQSIGWIMMALGGLALVVNQLMNAVLNWRKLREPPVLDATAAAKIKALEAEIHAVETRMEKKLSTQLGAIDSRLGSLEGTLTHIVGDFNYALGKVDALLAKLDPES